MRRSDLLLGPECEGALLPVMGLAGVATHTRLMSAVLLMILIGGPLRRWRERRNARGNQSKED